MLEKFKFLIFLRIKMKILKQEELEAKLNERYNDHPEGWKCFHTHDKKGYYAIGWVNRKIGEQYWFKFSSQYSPNGIGCISTFNEDFQFLKDTAFDRDYGIRIVDITRDEEKRMFETGKMISSVIEKFEKAMNKPPEPNNEEKPRLCGPRNIIITCLEDISSSQRELEIKMQEEIERLTKNQTHYIS